jgi:hypothetical protein
MKMQGLLVDVTPRAKLEIAQGRYTGLGMFTAATGNFRFSKFSKCRVQMQPDVAFETSGSQLPTSFLCEYSFLANCEICNDLFAATTYDL